MEDQENPYEPDSVLRMKGLHFPVSIGEGVFEESCNVLESSPFLSHVSRFSSSLNEFSKISICFLGKSSKWLTIKERK